MVSIKEMIIESMMNESTTRDYVDNVMSTSLKRNGVVAKVTKKIGFTSYAVGPWTIINDGVGIAVKKDGKEVEYFGTPKLDYKKAVEMVSEEITHQPK